MAIEHRVSRANTFFNRKITQKKRKNQQQEQHHYHRAAAIVGENAPQKNTEIGRNTEMQRNQTHTPFTNTEKSANTMRDTAQKRYIDLVISLPHFTSSRTF